MSKWLPQWTILLVILACLSLMGLEGWRDWMAHDQKLRETSTSLANLAASLTQHAEDTVDLADAVLLGIVERLQVDGTSPPALDRLSTSLRTEVDGLSRIHAFIVFGEDGNWLATSMPKLGQNDQDRLYFRHHLESPSSDAFIGPPMRSRSRGHWTITISHRFNHPDGRFAGVALAEVDAEYFSQHFATYDLGPNQVVALFSTSGKLMARNPPDETAMGMDFSNGPLLTSIREGFAGTLQMKSMVDGVERIIGYRRSGRYPFVTFASTSVDHAFASWRADARTHVATALLLSTVLAVLGLYLARQLWRRSAAETRLREGEARYRLLAEKSVDLIAIKPLRDGGGSYVSPSVRTIVGYEPADFAAFDETLYLHPEDIDRVKAIQSGLSKGSPRATSVHRVRHKAGHWVWMDVAFQLANAGTGDESIVVTARDVTLRRQLEAERAARQQELEKSNAEFERAARHLARARDAAEQANRAKSRFLAGISHELRTPLHGILGYAQMLRTEAKLDDVQRGRVDAMLGAGNHLLTMINGVLDLSQIDAERLELQVAETDVRSVAEACVELVRPGADAKALALSLLVQPSVPRHVMCDPGRLRQILLNLLGNAVKFTDEGSIVLRLAVVAAAAGPSLRLEVMDTGPGIQAERRPRLFQDFDRLDAGASSGAEGAGLGLALSHRLTALMGGRLGHDPNPSGGSVFWLELPLAAGQEATDIPGNDDPVRQQSSAVALRVLVVDDVVINRDIARSFLMAGGHDVTCAAGGAEAVAAVAGADFDVVLMDVRMPGVDGLEATRRIRKLATGRSRVPIVAVTAQAFQQQVEECLAAGMDDHLAKPFGPASLLEAVAKAAARGPTDARVAATIAPEAGSDVLNNAVYEHTAAFLTPNTVASYLAIISARGEALVDAMMRPDAPRADLAEAAHTLAGSAGMFGFERLMEAARAVEHGLAEETRDADALTKPLSAAVSATIRVISERTNQLMVA